MAVGKEGPKSETVFIGDLLSSLTMWDTVLSMKLPLNSNTPDLEPLCCDPELSYSDKSFSSSFFFIKFTDRDY